MPVLEVTTFTRQRRIIAKCSVKRCKSIVSGLVEEEVTTTVSQVPGGFTPPKREITVTARRVMEGPFRMLPGGVYWPTKDVPCQCGWVRWSVKPVKGTFVPEKRCDGRCQAATGDVCECSCGGLNHGAAHSLAGDLS